MLSKKNKIIVQNCCSTQTEQHLSKATKRNRNCRQTSKYRDNNDTNTYYRRADCMVDPQNDFNCALIV
jgi:hypothetical protein